MSETQNCEICSTLSDHRLTINQYKHFQCRNCGHIFVFPKPSQKTLNSFYQQADYYESAESQLVRLRKESQKRIRLLEHLRDKSQLGRNLLDVGCATGCFLSVATEKGWDATGIDRSDAVARQACARSNIKVLNGLIENKEISEAPFPVVTAWEVLEHTVDPVSFFKALSQNASPGGLIAISTPLANGLAAKILGTRFPMLTPPEHLSIFTRKSLGILAAKFKYEEIHYTSFSNLGFKSLASGAYKYIFGKNLSSAGMLTKLIFNIFGLSFAWVPVLIDALGYGTEMQVVFKQKQA